MVACAAARAVWLLSLVDAVRATTVGHSALAMCRRALRLSLFMRFVLVLCRG